MSGKITVVGFPMVNEETMIRDGFTLECSECGPVGFLQGEEDAVHEMIGDHLLDAHGVEPAGFVFKEV